jgi:hypothetical protein
VVDLLGKVLVQVLRSLQWLPVTSLGSLDIVAQMIHHGQGYLSLIHVIFKTFLPIAIVQTFERLR